MPGVRNHEAARVRRWDARSFKGFDRTDSWLGNGPPLNLWFQVSFIHSINERTGVFAGSATDFPAPNQDVNRHGRGRKQQRNQRDEKAQN
jgi:hypothetical protein